MKRENSLSLGSEKVTDTFKFLIKQEQRLYGKFRGRPLTTGNESFKTGYDNNEHFIKINQRVFQGAMIRTDGL